MGELSAPRSCVAVGTRAGTSRARAGRSRPGTRGTRGTRAGGRGGRKRGRSSGGVPVGGAGPRLQTPPAPERHLFAEPRPAALKSLRGSTPPASPRVRPGPRSVAQRRLQRLRGPLVSELPRPRRPVDGRAPGRPALRGCAVRGRPGVGAQASTSEGGIRRPAVHPLGPAPTPALAVHPSLVGAGVPVSPAPS